MHVSVINTQEITIFSMIIDLKIIPDSTAPTDLDRGINGEEISESYAEFLAGNQAMRLKSAMRSLNWKTSRAIEVRTGEFISINSFEDILRADYTGKKEATLSATEIWVPEGGFLGSAEITPQLIEAVIEAVEAANRTAKKTNDDNKA